MASLSDLYNIWLKAESLPPDKVVGVTIERATVEEIHPRPGQTERRLILSFKGKTRRLIVNGGNANKLANLHGEDYTAYPGLVIGLKRTTYKKDMDTIHIVPAPAAPANGNGK